VAVSVDGAGRRTATCPDCGRPVVVDRAKLCPHCGYPLMFDTAPQAAASQPAFLRKPVQEERGREPDTGVIPGGPPPAWGRPEQALGPYCPGCGHRSPVGRVRCEICAHELWIGAAAPVRRSAQPATKVIRRRRGRAWVTVAALLAVPVAAVILVYLLSSLL
jgi:ribosomal protein L37AE/L43A